MTMSLFFRVCALIDLRILTHPSFPNYYVSSYSGKFFTTSIMKDLGEDLSFFSYF